MLETFVAIGLFIVGMALFLFAIIFWNKYRSEGEGLAKAIVFSILTAAYIISIFVCADKGVLDFVNHPDTLERNGYTYVRSDEPVKVIEHNGYEYYLEEE